MSEMEKRADLRLDQALAAPTVVLGTGFASVVMVKIITEKLKKTQAASFVTSVLLSSVIVLTVLALFTVFSYLGWFQFQAESLQSIISLLATVVNFVLPCGLAMIVLFGFDTIIRPQLQFPS